MLNEDSMVYLKFTDVFSDEAQKFVFGISGMLGLLINNEDVSFSG